MRWFAVHAVPDPAGALIWFAGAPGRATNRAVAEIWCGDLHIAVMALGRVPAGSWLIAVVHLALHTGVVFATALRLEAKGPVPLAGYRLARPRGPVEVRFLPDANLVWELPDEPVAAASV